MSEFRGVVAVYVDEHLLGRVEAKDADLNLVLADLDGLGLKLSQRIVRDILRNQKPSDIALMLAAAKDAGVVPDDD